MKTIKTLATSLLLTFGTLLPSAASGPSASTVADLNTVCPVSGKPADPKIVGEYEGVRYAFAEDACRTKFMKDREASLYHRLGGKVAIDAAVELFYTKVLADQRIKHFFDDVNMTKQRRRQKEFCVRGAFAIHGERHAEGSCEPSRVG